MKPPRLLFVMTLTLWGACTEILWFGVFLGISLEIIQFAHLQRSFEDQDLNRVVDLATLLSSGSVLYFIFSSGIAEGLIKTVVWLPISTLPIILGQIISASGYFRFRNVFYSLRRSILPIADQPVYLIYPYLILTLISASLATTNYLLFVPSGLIFSAYILFTMRPRDYSLTTWISLLIIAFGLGIGSAFGLNYLQAILEDFVIEWFATGPPNPYHTRTRIGDVGRIKLSDIIVWRIQIDHPIYEPLLLIDSIYTAFDGYTWRALHDIFRPLEPINPEGKYFFGNSIEHLASLHLSGYSENGQALLALPGATDSISGLGSAVVTVNSLGAVKITDAAPLLQLNLIYTPQLITRLFPTMADLEIPKSLENLFTHIRNEINPHSQISLDIVGGVKRFFREKFRYSLFLGNQPGGKSLRDFLTESRTGHCEYFATATTLLLRSFGIPARYITGYSVQEFAVNEGQYVARRRHAHAWSQAYINGLWQDIDTTPEIWRATEQEQRNPFISIMDWISWRWYRYNEWRTHNPTISNYWLISGGGLLFIWFYWRLLRRPKISEKQSRLSLNKKRISYLPYVQMEDKLIAAGYVRPIGETPLHWVQRLRREGCPYISISTEELVWDYYRFKFLPK